MAIPYDQTNAGTSIRNALGHSSIYAGSDGWKHIEDIQVKDGGAWRDTKEVYVKSGVHGDWYTKVSISYFKQLLVVQRVNLIQQHGLVVRDIVVTKLKVLSQQRVYNSESTWVTSHLTLKYILG